MEREVELTEAVTLSIVQSADLGLGGSVWDAALILCYLLATPQCQALLPAGGRPVPPLPPLPSSAAGSGGCPPPSPWSSQVVCELGSGTGVCGLAAAALGAPRVVLTDLDAYLPLLRRNVDRNRRLFPSTAACRRLPSAGATPLRT